MIEYLREQIDGTKTKWSAQLIVREYLQVRILEALQKAGVFSYWAFLGGTALRLIYHLPRFSEDLDFSLRDPVPESEMPDFHKEFRGITERVKKELQKENYPVETKIREGGAVHSALIKIPELLKELDLSPYSQESVSVKIEIDASPPRGAAFDTRVVRRHVILNLQIHDKSSLFAGKLHALLSRKYTKGRDLYDLLWYTSDEQWPSPNLELLRNALSQTGWTGRKVTEEKWRDLIAEKIDEVHWSKAVKDVQPFLEKPHEAELLTKETLTRTLYCPDTKR